MQLVRAERRQLNVVPLSDHAGGNAKRKVVEVPQNSLRVLFHPDVPNQWNTELFGRKAGQQDALHIARPQQLDRVMPQNLVDGTVVIKEILPGRNLPEHTSR
ncbi:hypothetical protein [Stieleria neptunia]|uniref:hypothetical protein n=1 Tax=Stieleria neptunia TaxID=2527979 RepID=UPI001E41E324|nr:hypothetical protein [Stieleria neptunia]